MKAAMLAAVVVLAGAGGQQGKGLEIHWIDVEGGAATLIVAPSGESILMDCGWPDKRDAERIQKAAAAAGVKQIDHYLTSHWHIDHWGGVAELSGLLNIGTFYDHGFPDASAKDVDAKLKEAYLKACGGKNVVLKPGDSLPLKDKSLSVRILSGHGLVPGEKAGAAQIRKCAANPEHPAKPDDTSDNARSLGFVLSWGMFDFLDLGDLTWNVEHKLVCPENLIGKVDVYQVSHHGLAQSNSPALLRAVEPTVAVINNGATKGGEAAVYKLLKELPGLKDAWQVHRNVKTTPADNAPAELTANDEEKCQGAGLKLTVGPEGRSFTVEAPSKGTKREYASK